MQLQLPILSSGEIVSVYVLVVGYYTPWVRGKLSAVVKNSTKLGCLLLVPSKNTVFKSRLILSFEQSNSDNFPSPGLISRLNLSNFPNRERASTLEISLVVIPYCTPLYYIM